METASTTKEKENYINWNKAALYLLVEDRKYPIRICNNLPTKWLIHKQGELLQGEAALNECYTPQIGVWAAGSKTDWVGYQTSSPRCGGGVIPATAITCFNVEDTDPHGKTFEKEVNVAGGKVQALWFGIDVPGGQKEGAYTSTVTINGADGA